MTFVGFMPHSRMHCSNSEEPLKILDCVYTIVIVPPWWTYTNTHDPSITVLKDTGQTQS